MSKTKTLLVVLFLFAIAAESSAQTRGRKGPRRPPTTTPAANELVAKPQPTPSPDTVSAPRSPIALAIVNGQTITTSDLEPKVRQEIEALEARMAEARRQVMELQINTFLLESEAGKRRTTAQQLYDQEVARKISEPTAAQIAAFIEANRNQIQETDETAMRQKVVAYLRGEREEQLSAELVKRLRTTNPVVNVSDPNAPNLAPATVAATVSGRAITVGALNERLKPILYKLQFNNYTLAKQALDQTINDLLLLAEANRRGVPPEDIVRSEISDKIHPPTEAEIAKFYADNKARISSPLAEVSSQIATYLQETERRKWEDALSARLRTGAAIRVLLSEPALPLQSISVDDDPVRGEATAPVTIVEFTDFQCPSCAAMQPILEEVMKAYGTKVRLVVRDFPLPMHANARKAAEAANAANAQGKFFEYIDLLFKRQNALDIASLKKYATEVGLDRVRFDAALDGGKYAAEVKHDIDDGQLYGVDSTPAIFVNGVALTEMSVEALRALIDRGLAGTNSAPKTPLRTP